MLKSCTCACIRSQKGAIQVAHTCACKHTNRQSLEHLSHTLRSVAELWCNCGSHCRRACLSSEIMSGERGGIMKSGSHSPGTGFICSTLAIHKPLEQAPAALSSLRLSRLWQSVTGSLCSRSRESMRSAVFMEECFVLGCWWHSVRAESLNPHQRGGGAQV